MKELVKFEATFFELSKSLISSRSNISGFCLPFERPGSANSRVSEDLSLNIQAWGQRIAHLVTKLSIYSILDLLSNLELLSWFKSTGAFSIFSTTSSGSASISKGWSLFTAADSGESSSTDSTDVFAETTTSTFETSSVVLTFSTTLLRCISLLYAGNDLY